VASPHATAQASSSARAQASPASSATTAKAELCVSVQRAQASIPRGHNAAFVVTVSTQNGPAADVSVALTSAPSSQQPAFTSGCAKTAKAAACTVSSDAKPVSLDAEIPVAAGATSVSSVTLTATASIVSTVKGTPAAAQETVTVTAAPASPAKSSAPASLGTTVPLGALPNLNGVSSSLIGAGNASGLFPAISPGATAGPKPSPGVRAQGTRRNTESVSYTSTLGPVLTAQVAGLIALALAVMLTVTRLSLRRRFRSPKPGS
jgi:hypothetical protein